MASRFSTKVARNAKNSMIRRSKTFPATETKAMLIWFVTSRELGNATGKTITALAMNVNNFSGTSGSPGETALLRTQQRESKLGKDLALLEYRRLIPSIVASATVRRRTHHCKTSNNFAFMLIIRLEWINPQTVIWISAVAKPKVDQILRIILILG